MPQGVRGAGPEAPLATLGLCSPWPPGAVVEVALSISGLTSCAPQAGLVGGDGDYLPSVCSGRAMGRHWQTLHSVLPV